MITVVLPVGPEPHHKQFLPECINTIMPHLSGNDELLIVDDMAGLPRLAGITMYDPPWRLGCAGAWNAGIALARNELCFMMGADDWLLDGCIQALKDSYAKWRNNYGYYYVSIRYYDAVGNPQDTQTVPCNAAMVSKALWKRTGGFPPEVGVGAPDAAFISCMMVHKDMGTLIPVDGGPWYAVRRHPNQDTAMRGPYQGAILEVRNILTRDWKPTNWGRYE